MRHFLTVCLLLIWSAANALTPGQRLVVFGGGRTIAVAAALQPSDCGQLVKVNRSTQVTVTLPSTMPLGCVIRLQQIAAGAIYLYEGDQAQLHWSGGYNGTNAIGSVITLTVASNADGASAVYTGAGTGAFVYTYFVDSVGGNDGNAGTSFNAAFQNLTATPALTTGQSVCVEYGSQWNGQTLWLGLNGSPTKVVASGCGTSGALPIIDGSKTITNDLTTCPVDIGDGFTDTFICSVPGPGSSQSTPYGTYSSGVGTIWISVFECASAPCTPQGVGGNDKYLSNQISAANAHANAGSYFIAGMTTSANPSSTNPLTIYVHPSVACGNIPNGCTYTYSFAYGSVEANGIGVRVHDIVGKKNSDNNGSMVVQGDGGSALFAGVEADQGTKHNMFCSSGCTIAGSTITDGYYAGSSLNLVVIFDGVGTAKPLHLRNTVFNYGVPNLTAGQLPLMYFGHILAGVFTATLSVTNVSLSTSIASATSSGIDSPATETTVDGLYCKGSQKPCIGPINPGATITVKNSFYENGASSASYSFGIFVDANAAGQTLNLTNNIACLTAASGAVFSLFNNTSININGGRYAITNGFSNIQTQTGTGNVIAINGVTFPGRASSSGAYALGGAGTGTTYTGDNNHFTASMSSYILNGNASSTLALWKTAVSPQDAHSDTATATISTCPDNPAYTQGF